MDYSYWINDGKHFVVDGDVYKYANILSVDCTMDKNGNPIYNLEIVREDVERKYCLKVKGMDACAFDRFKVREKTLMQWRKQRAIQKEVCNV